MLASSFMAGEKPAARLTDMHTCPEVTGIVPHVGGPLVAPGAPTVLIGGLPAARVSDMVTCIGPPDTIVQGSTSVFIGGMQAARMGDLTTHGGVIVQGDFTVLIGDAAGSSGNAGAMGAGAVATHPCLATAAAAGAPFVRSN